VLNMAAMAVRTQPIRQVIEAELVVRRMAGEGNWEWRGVAVDKA